MYEGSSGFTSEPTLNSGILSFRYLVSQRGFNLDFLTTNKVEHLFTCLWHGTSASYFVNCPSKSLGHFSNGSLFSYCFIRVILYFGFEPLLLLQAFSLWLAISFFFFLIYFWLCWVFVAASGGGLLFVVARGLLIAVASLVAEHRL